MIPFFAPEPVSIGPLSFSWWQLLVITGIVVGTFFGIWRARREGLSVQLQVEYMVVVVGSGFVVGRLFTLFVYDLGDGWRDLDVWGGGYSSIGGFVGAGVAMTLYTKVYRKAPVWAYYDNSCIGFLLGWCFGRIGCSLAHDHIGRSTGWFTGIRFPADWPKPGVELGVRHDLGLYEAVFCIGLVALMVLLDRKERFHGFFSVIGLLGYSSVRFGLDFLRATDLEEVAGRTSDVRRLGLTPAQWGCLAMFAFGVWVLLHRRDKGRQDTSAEAARDRR